MGQIKVYAPEISYRLSEDNEWLCTHESYTVTPPCCNGQDCGCQGRHSIDCENSECTGFTDREIELIMEGYHDGSD